MFNKIKQLYFKYKEIINYLVVGGLTFVVSMASYFACVLTVFDPKDPLLLQAANVISWICAVAFAYATNRKYVFESRDKNIFKECSAFFASRVTTLLMEMGIMFVTVSLIGMDDKISKFIAQAVVIISNYIFSKFLVFGKNKDSQEKEPDIDETAESEKKE